MSKQCPHCKELSPDGFDKCQWCSRGFDGYVEAKENCSVDKQELSEMTTNQEEIKEKEDEGILNRANKFLLNSHKNLSIALPLISLLLISLCSYKEYQYNWAKKEWFWTTVINIVFVVMLSYFFYPKKYFSPIIVFLCLISYDILIPISCSGRDIPGLIGLILVIFFEMVILIINRFIILLYSFVKIYILKKVK